MSIMYILMLTIIADVHAEAKKLHKLIEAILLANLSADVCASKIKHKIIFSGDIIGRGPHNLETMMIVCELVEQNIARIVLGNYEKALLAWYNGDVNSESYNQDVAKYYEPALQQIQAEVEAAGPEGEKLLARFVNILRRSYAWVVSDDQSLVVAHAIWNNDYLEPYGYTPKYFELDEKGRDCLGVVTSGHLNFSHQAQFTYTEKNVRWVKNLEKHQTVCCGHVSVPAITAKSFDGGGTAIFLDTLAKTGEIGRHDIDMTNRDTKWLDRLFTN